MVLRRVAADGGWISCRSGRATQTASQAIDDNRIENYMGKATWHSHIEYQVSFMFNRNLKSRFHRRDAPYLFSEDKASVLQDQPAQNYVAQINQVSAGRRSSTRDWPDVGRVPDPLSEGSEAERHRDPRHRPHTSNAATSSRSTRPPVPGERHARLLCGPRRRQPRLQVRHPAVVGKDASTTASGTAICSSSRTTASVARANRQYAGSIRSPAGDMGRLRRIAG